MEGDNAGKHLASTGSRLDLPYLEPPNTLILWFHSLPQTLEQVTLVSSHQRPFRTCSLAEPPATACTGQLPTQDSFQPGTHLSFHLCTSAPSPSRCHCPFPRRTPRCTPFLQSVSSGPPTPDVGSRSQANPQAPLQASCMGLLGRGLLPSAHAPGGLFTRD